MKLSKIRSYWPVLSVTVSAVLPYLGRLQAELAAAAAAFETAWQLLPNSAVVAGNLAQTYQVLGRSKEAAEWQALAGQLAPQQ